MQEKIEENPDLEQAMERTIGEEEGWRCRREGTRRNVNTIEVEMVEGKGDGVFELRSMSSTSFSPLATHDSSSVSLLLLGHLIQGLFILQRPVVAAEGIP